MTTERRGPLMSGFCAHPNKGSHEKCAGFSTANPKKIVQPCPCACHLGEEYECGNCGRPIREALMWPRDEDGEMVYVHLDVKDGRGTSEDCPPGKVKSRGVNMEAVETTAEADAELMSEMMDAEFAAPTEAEKADLLRRVDQALDAGAEIMNVEIDAPSKPKKKGGKKGKKKKGKKNKKKD